MKKFIPFISSFLTLIVISFFWDHIKLPYDESNVIVGNYYFKKFNPLNDTIRFLFFTVIPSIVYLVSYLNLNKEVYIKKNNILLEYKQLFKNNFFYYIHFYRN